MKATKETRSNEIKLDQPLAQELVDDKISMLIMAGAAVAASYRPCLEELLPRLRDAGLPTELIHGAIQVGNAVRAKPVAMVKQLIETLSVAGPPEQSAAGGCPAGQLEPGYAYNVTMLIGAGAAMAANCEWCLSQAVPNLIEAGVADEDIRRAVQIGQSVKDRVSTVMKEAADLMAGTQFLREAVPETCFADQTDGAVACRAQACIASA
jgi:alkylhydroperoxidase/carboxymuconolactone decarboxylase family protein YurZ